MPRRSERWGAGRALLGVACARRRAGGWLSVRPWVMGVLCSCADLTRCKPVVKAGTNGQCLNRERAGSVARGSLGGVGVVARGCVCATRESVDGWSTGPDVDYSVNTMGLQSLAVFFFTCDRCVVTRDGRLPCASLAPLRVGRDERSLEREVAVSLTSHGTALASNHAHVRTIHNTQTHSAPREETNSSNERGLGSGARCEHRLQTRVPEPAAGAAGGAIFWGFHAVSSDF